MDGKPRSTGYLFTDIDGSTQRWERTPAQMKDAHARHNRIIEDLVERHGGVVRDRAGDGIFAAFENGDPLRCALEIQIALQRQDWEAVGGLEIRIGVHPGEADGDLSPQVSINRAARIAECAWGGQIVLSAEAVNAFSLPHDSWLTDLGVCRLKGIDEPFRLFSLSHRDLARTDFPPPRANTHAGPPPASSSTPMFGRDRECAEILGLLEDDRTRIVSLAGAGGNGKTRLAAQVGMLAQERWPVWFAPLDTVSDGAGLFALLARALRFPLYGAVSPLDQLTDYLVGRRGLLILDNIDAVIAETAEFVAHIQGRCAHLRVLTTSRSPLLSAQATVCRVHGLPKPGPSDEELQDSAAFRLFAREVQADHAGFVFDKAEYGAFRDLFALVNGSPLALRLAAQWRRILPVSEIVTRVRSDLDFLQATNWDRTERHRSIRSVFEGSWASLTEKERDGLMNLSIFAGGFDALGAEAAGGLSLNTLLALEHKGLLERLDGDRLTMHPLIRGYARERLAGAALAEQCARTRHSAYYLELVGAQLTDTSTCSQYVALERLARENDNILLAWRYAFEHQEWERIEKAAEPLFYALVLRARYRDAREFFGEPTGHAPLDSHLGSLLANCLVQQGELDDAFRLAQSARHGDSSALARAHAHQALGLIAHARGDIGGAKGHYEEALTLRRALDDQYGSFYSTASLAILHILQKDGARAREAIKESFRCGEQSSNATGLMIVHSLAGDLAANEGRTEDARAGYMRSLQLEQNVHHPQHRARVLTKLGDLMAAIGDSSAVSYHRQALACAVQIGDVRHKIEALLAVASDLRKQGRAEKAKVRMIQAMRLALELSARPLLILCVLDLANLEADMGNEKRAQRLAAVLADAELGLSESKYVALLARLPKLPRDIAQTTPEAFVGQLVSDAELESLRL
jgi:class 3 adenylate cyclase/predicted ATPase